MNNLESTRDTHALAPTGGVGYEQSMNTSSSGTARDEVLLTAADLLEWQKQIENIDNQMRALGQEREFFAKKLSAAREFIAFVKGDTSFVNVDNVGNMPATAIVDPNAVAATAKWRDAIMTWLRAAPLGLTYAELRNLIDQSPLRQRFIESEKGYYNAISRLAGHGEIVKHNGRLFTPSSFKAFKEAVDKGQIDDDKPVPTSAYSPMGEAILQIVRDQPGIVGKDVIAELRKDPEFNATLTPHSTGAYNIIARLVKRHQLIRRDDGQIYPGTKFPKELGAPNGSTASAPKVTGEGWTPSPFRQRALQLD